MRTIENLEKLVGNSPLSLGVNLLTNAIYVASFGDNNVAVIDGNTNAIVDTIPVGNGPNSIGINP
ncbi:hypothetical protein [Paenibacillus sp. CECT 9249]|uniref:YncE family protein n=1 Tax=unclassified Paenibacillus TaxID=185978 RepID=UPI001C11AC00|nr:hypothetical protein [Paenibacillus sp. MSJ-34]